MSKPAAWKILSSTKAVRRGISIGRIITDKEHARKPGIYGESYPACYKPFAGRFATRYQNLTALFNPHKPRNSSTLKTSPASPSHIVPNALHVQKTSTTTANNKDDERTRTTGWRSLLGSKSLGAASSIIVLRDSEKKRGGRNTVQKEPQRNEPIDEMKMDEILAKIKKQEEAPGQEEVNQSIEALRPLKSTVDNDESVAILRATFNQILKSLAEQFNNQQLSNYVAIKAGSDILKAREASRLQSGAPTVHLRTSKSEWHPLSHGERSIASLKGFHGRRGKKALAKFILRSVWMVEIVEEIEKTGIMDLVVEPRQLSILLLGGQDSALSELGKTQNVKIDVYKTRNVIKITAAKVKCNQVATAIEQLLGNVHEIILDFEPFQMAFSGESGFRSNDDGLRAIAATIPAAIEILKGGKKILIRSRSKEDSDRCQRALVAAADLNLRANTLLATNTSSNKKGVICGTARGLAPLCYRSEHQNFGRFTTAIKLGHGGTPPSIEIPKDVLSIKLIDRIHEHLTIPGLPNRELPPLRPQSSAENTDQCFLPGGDKLQTFSSHKLPYWQMAPQMLYSAKFGHIMHALDETTVQILTGADLLQQADKSSHRFVGETPGLHQFLVRSLPELIADTTDLLRFQLIPSPWQQLKHKDLLNGPRLELTISINRSSQSVAVNRVTAIFANNQVNLMLPSLATDIQFSSRNTLDLVNPELDVGIKQFVKDIEDSAAGYGRLVNSTFLRLSVPRPMTKTTTGRVNQVMNTKVDTEEIELEYFITSQEFLQLTTFDYRGYNLIYSVVGKGQDGGKSADLALHTLPDNGSDAGEPSALPTHTQSVSSSGIEKSMSNFLPFIRTVSRIVTRLSAAVSPTKMTALDPKEETDEVLT